MPVINTTMLDQQGCHHTAVTVTMVGRQGACTGHHSDQLGQSSQVYTTGVARRLERQCGLGRVIVLDWIGLSSVLRPSQHSIGYMGDGFYRSKDPTNKVLKEQIVHRQIKHTIIRHEHSKPPSLQ